MKKNKHNYNNKNTQIKIIKKNINRMFKNKLNI